MTVHVYFCRIRMANDSKWKLWLKRLGVAGFLFFLLKGLAWLAVFYFGVNAVSGC